MTWRFLRWAALSAAAVAPGRFNAQITVGHDVQVSVDRGATAHGEFLACADPAVAKRMLVGTIAAGPLRGGVTSVEVYASYDRGATWRLTLDDTRSPAPGDPTCAFGLGDTVYFATGQGY